MKPFAAGAIVFLSSAAVLVLEILTGRLLAPYFGTSLETFTAIIGVVLGGIAFGTWLGGRLADQLGPRSLIAAELLAGGALTLLVVPVLRLLGPPMAAAGPPGLVVTTALTVFVPAAVLSAVAPTVVKLALRDLGETGRVVGRLSALGTAGAILGTFATGFVLVRFLPSNWIIAGLGGLLVAGGVAAWARLGRPASLLVLGLVSAAGLLLTLLLPSPCDVETRYACAAIEVDPANPSGRLLVLDGADNSYVDLADLTHLQFTYTRMFAAVIEAHTTGQIRAVHIGGGGFTMPRWVEATRPGSESQVLEIDTELVEVARTYLGLHPSPGIEIVPGDARQSLDDLAPGAADVVLGDAFSGLTVPWHLTTVEAAEQIEVALSPGGVYAVNIIDHGQLEFLRAEAATLEQVFENVAVVSLPGRFRSGGNFVIVASNRPLLLEATVDEAAELGLDLAAVPPSGLDRFLGDARVLIDDHAPVDQLRA